jgi:hypothetical protein
MELIVTNLQGAILNLQGCKIKDLIKNQFIKIIINFLVLIILTLNKKIEILFIYFVKSILKHYIKFQKQSY